MKRIEGRVRAVKQLLHGSRYTIDFYQREYAWKERQVRELVDDLTGRFLDFFDPEHERREVKNYGHYFLGAIVISHKREQKFIVDGQQRLTTLTLLLIYLDSLQRDSPSQVNVRDLIFSEVYGELEFNLNVPDRLDCMERLFKGESVETAGASESVQNIAGRFENIGDYFPEEVTGVTLPYFMDWLLENVHFVEIEAFSDEDAYTIFETMNDRGLSLSLPDMLKGYLLANIADEKVQREVNDLWKSHIESLRRLSPEEDVDFFKAWLRAKHAVTIRPGKRGAENRDYERIGSEFHRWVRDHRESIGLEKPSAFIRFVKRDVDFFAKQTQLIRGAAINFTSGLESIWFNEDRGFTLQTQLLLAPLTPEDSQNTILKKLALTADFLDIWLARRLWNFRTTSQSSVKHTLFNLSLGIRDKSVEELSSYLSTILAEQEDTFAQNLDFRLHGTNFRQVRHILARLTYWVDQECGRLCNFEDLVAPVKSKKFEIEHIWPNHFEHFQHLFDHTRDFEVARNRIGGLILLQQGHNQSLGDLPYERKRNAYVTHGQNLLAGSLSPLVYENNPSFQQFLKRTGLPFRPYDSFGSEAQAERQELYLRIAEWVWNPSRLDLDGLKDPLPEPLEDPEDRVPSPVDQSERHALRLEFWTGLLEVAREMKSIHAHISPRTHSWISTRVGGLWWNYVVLQTQTRVELYIDFWEQEKNKAMFDHLFGQRQEIEAVLGRPLEWERLDNKRASRVSLKLDGGWLEKGSREALYPKLIACMEKFHAILKPRAQSEEVTA